MCLFIDALWLRSIAKQVSNVHNVALGISSNQAVLPSIVAVQRAEGGLSGDLANPT